MYGLTIAGKGIVPNLLRSRRLIRALRASGGATACLPDHGRGHSVWGWGMRLDVVGRPQLLLHLLWSSQPTGIDYVRALFPKVIAKLPPHRSARVILPVHGLAHSSSMDGVVRIIVKKSIVNSCEPAKTSWIEFRLASAGDEAAIVGRVEHALRAGYGNCEFASELPYKRLALDLIVELQRVPHIILIAVVDGQAIGHALIDMTCPIDYAGVEAPMILDVFVDAPFTGRGVAATIYEYVESLLGQLGVQQVYSSVAGSNLIAVISNIAKLGWRADCVELELVCGSNCRSNSLGNESSCKPG